MRKITVLALGAPLILASFVNTSFAQTEFRQPLTAASSIEMRRLEYAAGMTNESPISFSPDGRRYLIRIAGDDLEAGGTWVEFLSGLTDSLDVAPPTQIARLFTTGAIDRQAGSVPPTHPAYTEVTWLDNDRFLFLWSEGNAPTQIMLADVLQSSVRQLTNHRTAVTGFRLIRSLGGSGDAIVYSVFPELDDEQSRRRLPNGFTVAHVDALNTVLSGEFTPKSSWLSTTPYIFDLRANMSRRMECALEECQAYYFSMHAERLSAHGKYMAFFGYDGPAVWRVVALDRQNATISELWRQHGETTFGFNPIWSPSEERVILGPVAMSPGESADAFVEVDPVTGKVWQLPIRLPSNHLGSVSPVTSVRWRRDGVVELRQAGNLVAFRKKGPRWEMLPDVPPLTEPQPRVAPVSVEVRQDIETPPTVVAVDRATGSTRELLEVEPRLREHSLGRVELVEFADAEGTVWEGRLTYPVGYERGTRYPMVITTSGEKAGSSRFSLVGLYEHIGPLYAAQALANRGIAVLSLSDRATTTESRGMTGFLGTSREGEKITMGFEAAIDHFVTAGLARPDAIGLAGFSRTGSFVQQAITRSSYPFAAAISSDNANFGYFQAVMKGDQGGEFSQVNGSVAYGEGLRQWLESAPPFKAHKIRTPLRIEALSGVGSLLYSWEMFSQLRALKKPVELVLAPFPENAMHAPQMPIQKLFSQGGTVDWFDFWLNGHEDPAPDKAAQYERWRKLRQQQQASLARRSTPGVE